LNDKSQPTPGPHVDGVIGFVSTSAISQVVRQLSQLVVTNNPTSTGLAMTSNTSAQSTDVNMVQTSKTSRRKNLNQRKKNAPIEQSEANVKEPNPSNNNRGKKKLKFPCLACKEDHFPKDCPRLADV
jgi:ribosomal protein L44E